MMDVVTWLAVFVADPSPLPEEPPIDPSRVTPGLLGLVSFIFLIIAVVLLYRSMRHQMRKVDASLPKGPQDERLDADARYIADAEARGEASERGERGGAAAPGP